MIEHLVGIIFPDKYTYYGVLESYLQIYHIYL